MEVQDHDQITFSVLTSPPPHEQCAVIWRYVFNFKQENQLAYCIKNSFHFLKISNHNNTKRHKCENIESP
jgi:hypothetical protein